MCSQLTEEAATGCVLAAFNRHHFQPFRERFLRSLRATGNSEQVIALALGLYPSERQRLRNLSGVTPFFRNDDGQKVARQRIQGFQRILSTFPPEKFVAYWDAGDVIFQTRVQAIWELVRKNPDKLLVAREPKSHPESPTVAAWTRGIIDSAARRESASSIISSAMAERRFCSGHNQRVVEVLSYRGKLV